MAISSSARIPSLVSQVLLSSSPIVRSLDSDSLYCCSGDEAPVAHLVLSALAPGLKPADTSTWRLSSLQKWKEEYYDKGPRPFVREFTGKEIKKATDGFCVILRSGPHGTMYRARFPDGHVAVVRKERPSQKGKDTFNREVQLLGRLHHRHVVRLAGFSEGHDRFLVFDHMENGSLKEYLHDPLRTPLNWRTRLQIAIDIAAALEYLHYFCDPPVYVVSINSNNIFLDENFVAKLADVGLLYCDCNHVDGSNAACSRDHIEQRSRNMTFQFGMLILELVTGQSLDSEDAELVQWVQESRFTNSMHKMVDADLGDQYDFRELKSLLVIARLCTKAGDEPMISIPQILRYLQEKVESSVLRV